MAKKSEKEWIKFFEDTFTEYLREYPDTDIVFFLNTYIEGEIDKPDVMAFTGVYDDKTLEGIFEYLRSHYAATSKMIYINVEDFMNEFSKEYKYVDIWINGKSPFSEN